MNVLEKYRQRKNLTYRELADLLDCDSGNVWRLCNHGINMPKSVVKVAALLKKDELFIFRNMLKGKENEE